MTGTSEAPTVRRPQGRSAPPAARSDSCESTRPSKRRRGSECFPHRSACRVQVHVHSRFVGHRGRRDRLPQSHPTERSYAHSPRALKPSHMHRPTADPLDDARSSFNEGSLAAVLLAPHIYPREFDRLMKFRELDMCGAFIATDGFSSCPQDVHVIVFHLVFWLSSYQTAPTS